MSNHMSPLRLQATIISLHKQTTLLITTCYISNQLQKQIKLFKHIAIIHSITTTHPITMRFYNTAIALRLLNPITSLITHHTVSYPPIATTSIRQFRIVVTTRSTRILQLTQPQRPYTINQLSYAILHQSTIINMITITIVQHQ